MKLLSTITCLTLAILVFTDGSIGCTCPPWDSDCSCDYPHDSYNDCWCPQVIEVVCGSDATNYPNECSLDCAQRDKPGLTLLHEGRCTNQDYMNFYKGI